MRTLKLTVTISLVALAARTASAITPVTPPPQTYMFTADPDFTTVYNGSTITLQGTSSTTGIALVDWNLLSSSSPTSVNKTNSNVTSQAFSFYDSSTFYGSFEITGFAPGEVFDGSNDAINGGFLQRSADPPGVWNAVPAAGVPDSGSALQLLGIAFGGLAAARRWLCVRA